VLKTVLFVVASAGIVYVSRASLRAPRSHGFYRFFAWEAILALILVNVEYWLRDPFSLHQVVSWILLLASAFVVMLGQVPVGEALYSKMPLISQWIMKVPNTASKRGVDLGITLGALATMLKILTGVERSWMGGGK